MVAQTLNLTVIVIMCIVSFIAQAPAQNISMEEIENLCPLGCLSCSKWNGCVDCAKNFTWHLEKSYMRKIGVCVRHCPRGYFIQEIVHAPGHFKCIECKAEHCDKCANMDFCEKCRQPYLEYRGTCIERCPAGFYHSKYRKDCYEKVDCLVEPWAEWSECERDGRKCGYKWGNRTRSRGQLQKPSPNGNPCPSSVQSQKCKLTERYCNFNNTVKLSPITNERHSRRKLRRRARCRLQRKAGKPCKREEHDPLTVENYAPTIQTVEKDKNGHNITSYYDYYKQSAELLQLLNLQQNNRRSRKNKKAKQKKNPG